LALYDGDNKQFGGDTMEILKVENLCKTYGAGGTQVRAVDDISFSVEKGEFVAIMGASGSGKSTLLHLIGGVDRPTSGTVRIDGQDLCAGRKPTCDLPPPQRRADLPVLQSAADPERVGKYAAPVPAG
jgi:ABC-type Fe3+/spermidine/putrescine transport system ATPase subunit